MGAETEERKTVNWLFGLRESFGVQLVSVDV